MVHLPSPRSDFLIECVESLRRRTKALGSRGRYLHCDRVIVVEDGVRSEKLEIDQRGRTPNSAPAFRLDIWDDRWVWVEAYQASKQGWVWQWNTEGRAFGVSIARTIISKFEATISAAAFMTSVKTDEFDAIWMSLLASGPSGKR